MHVQRAARRVAAAIAAPLMLAGVVAGLGSAAASAATCQAWTGVQQPPSPGNGNNDLSGVTVITPCNAWAVGTDINGGQAQTLIEHWNGASWTVVPSLNPGDRANSLFGVRAVSANVAWAVGSSTDSNTGTTTLILHWDGFGWTRVSSPDFTGSDFLGPVAATSNGGFWTTGASNADGPAPEQALAIHCC
jgi:hypothetical protein